MHHMLRRRFITIDVGKTHGIGALKLTALNGAEYYVIWFNRYTVVWTSRVFFHGLSPVVIEIEPLRGF